MKPFEKISNARKNMVKRILIEGIEQEFQISLYNPVPHCSKG